MTLRGPECQQRDISALSVFPRLRKPSTLTLSELRRYDKQYDEFLLLQAMLSMFMMIYMSTQEPKGS